MILLVCSLALLGIEGFESFCVSSREHVLIEIYDLSFVENKKGKEELLRMRARFENKPHNGINLQKVVISDIQSLRHDTTSNTTFHVFSGIRSKHFWTA